MDDRERRSREQGLRRAVLAGDEDAWRALYEQAFGPVLGFVRRRCGNDAHLVEEVLQEVWMVAVRRIRRFDPERAPFSAWVAGIARNVLHNAWRSDGRRSPAGIVDADSVPGPDADVLGGLERGEQIALAMGMLPGRYRAVLRAKYMQELTVAEIAERTLATTKAVESLLSRARAAFRSAYRGLPGSEHHDGT